MKNEMTVQFSSVSENESFARITIAAFIQPLDPTMDELTEIKTVVSEAVTNAIIHGYENNPNQKVYLSCTIEDSTVTITVRDEGCGIADIETAKEPLYTSKPELERSGMGFTIMDNFMDHVTVHSNLNEGTTVVMKKQLISAKTVCH